MVKGLGLDSFWILRTSRGFLLVWFWAFLCDVKGGKVFLCSRRQLTLLAMTV